MGGKSSWNRKIVWAVTGHRPNKLGGYDFQNPKRIWIRDRLKKILTEGRPAYCISGMALGVDQDFAYVSLELGIHVLAAVPFEGQESIWPEESQRFYWALRSRCFHTVVVSPGGYAAAKLLKRNEWMVDNCSKLIAVWDGTSGGTSHCVHYAVRAGREIYRINPNDCEVS